MKRIFARQGGLVLSMAVVIACALLAVQTVHHVLEAKLLGEGRESRTAAREPSPELFSAQPPRTKSGAALVARNPFCSTCRAPAATRRESAGGAAGSKIVVTSLPLELLATHIAENQDHSLAVVVDRQSARGGTFGRGARIPGAGTVERIAPTFIEFRNQSTLELERVSLLAAQQTSTTSSRHRPHGESDPPAPVAGSGDPFASGIRQLGPQSFEVERALIEQVMANPMAAGGIRVVPAAEDGQARGFRIFLRADSAYRRLGLQDGDTLMAVNGLPTTSGDAMMQVMGTWRSANRVTLGLERGGQRLELEYGLR